MWVRKAIGAAGDGKSNQIEPLQAPGGHGTLQQSGIWKEAVERLR